MAHRTASLVAATPDVNVAVLIGDRVRARMLFSLLDRRELSASELASRAAASPQAASAHLSKLVRGGLVDVRSAGRRRMFRLASAVVADAIEALASIAPMTNITSLNQHTRMQRLCKARMCYDHLAGRLGVEVADALTEKGVLCKRGGVLSCTRAGKRWFQGLGIDVDGLREGRRPLVRVCLDWTERRQHLAGSLGAGLLTYFLRAKWLVRNTNDRALHMTSEGQMNFERRFGIVGRYAA
jgi:DNA-binding transcriptional ArsR family regulator